MLMTICLDDLLCISWFQAAGQQFSLRPLHGDLGVEVIGVNLKGGISPELHAELQKVMHTKDLLLFRGQVSTVLLCLPTLLSMPNRSVKKKTPERKDSKESFHKEPCYHVPLACLQAGISDYKGPAFVKG